MDKQAALAQLKDIHLPDAIGWWPPAVGWWLVIAIVALVMAWLSWRSWRWWQAMKPKRQALRILEKIESKAKSNIPVNDTCAQVSQLLRRVALTYYPVNEVAGLKGDAWIIFLNNHSDNVNFNAVRDHLLVYPYCNQAQASLTPLFDRTRIWIKQRRQPWLK
ncbi:DUF4381 domain-containing protein [Legionella sp. W05-934-2]|jgi:hypothetical protein|uniref:DUF4381 domain-containing protein n=1 Tax=Legionella sp. W05-934-2 TaxID=1198649 RepID=UPI003462F975